MAAAVLKLWKLVVSSGFFDDGPIGILSLNYIAC